MSIHFTPSGDGSAEHRLKHTFYLVEGDAYSLWCQHSSESLFPPWNTRENRRAYPARKWEQVSVNPWLTVGSIGKRPVCLSFEWYRIDGQWVCFWEATSQLVDHAMIDKWLTKHFPDQHSTCDAGNFHNCLHAIDDANKPGYVKPPLPKTAAETDAGFVGSRRTVIKCEGKEHVKGDEGCVCHLIGKIVTISRRYDSPFCGTASYHLKGHKQRVRRSEVGLPDVMN